MDQSGRLYCRSCRGDGPRGACCCSVLGWCVVALVEMAPRCAHVTDHAVTRHGHHPTLEQQTGRTRPRAPPGQQCLRGVALSRVTCVGAHLVLLEQHGFGGIASASRSTYESPMLFSDWRPRCPAPSAAQPDPFHHLRGGQVAARCTPQRLPGDTARQTLVQRSQSQGTYLS